MKKRRPVSFPAEGWKCPPSWQGSRQHGPTPAAGSQEQAGTAARRAEPTGYTRYKGGWVTTQQLHLARANAAQRRRTAGDNRKPRGGAKYTGRLRMLSLNVGSRSTLLWQELKEYLLKAPYEFVCLQETHWTMSSEFIVQGWRAIHSGTKARADGVLTLLHPRHKTDTIRHEEIQPGRILRTQIQTPQGRVEVFNCYQYPYHAGWQD